MSDALTVMETALTTIANHTHNGGSTPKPDQSGIISGAANQIGSIKSSRLDPITE
ncbi:hypothetical protein [Endozoicomonas montiporae]|uniref:hypothetical protein n=1 Tax=Endozoicomonas montiporae TaxID=1027273 RepID=UPI001650E85B|nr:hypothetical protein [Endozoicomonas montiporae]